MVKTTLYIYTSKIIHIHNFIVYRSVHVKRAIGYHEYTNMGENNLKTYAELFLLFPIL